MLKVWWARGKGDKEAGREKSGELEEKGIASKPGMKIADLNQQEGAWNKPPYCWFGKGKFKGRESTICNQIVSEKLCYICADNEAFTWGYE